MKYFKFILVIISIIKEVASKEIALVGESLIIKIMILEGIRKSQNWIMTVKMKANQYQAIKYYILTSEYPK